MCCFLLKYHQEEIKRKEKGVGTGNIFKKIEWGVYHNLMQKMRVSDRESNFMLFVMNFLAKVMKKNVRPFNVWLGPLLFIKIILKTAQLFSKHFPSGFLSLCILFFLFHKSKDTSGIVRPSVQDLVYVFAIFFRFHKCFNNFHLSENILINKFFYWNVFVYSFTSMARRSCQFLFEVK